MKAKKEFLGTIIKSSGKLPKIGDRLWVEACPGMSYKEEIVIRGGEGFLGYPDTQSYCILFELLNSGKNISVEIIEIKKEGICNALFVEN